MNVLAIDGALGGFSAAVTGSGENLATLAISGQVALEQGLGAVAAVMETAQLSAGQIQRIGVGTGPGGFTGLRIALSYAKSLAQAWRVSIAGVSSFDALELGLEAEGPLLAVVCPRAGVVSVRLRAGGIYRRESGRTADVLNALARDLPRELNVVGAPEDVLGALGERGINVHAFQSVVQPAALAVALACVQQEPASSTHELRADYGELPAAKLPKR